MTTSHSHSLEQACARNTHLKRKKKYIYKKNEEENKTLEMEIKKVS
jgi:hypothetical protein